MGLDAPRDMRDFVRETQRRLSQLERIPYQLVTPVQNTIDDIVETIELTPTAPVELSAESGTYKNPNEPLKVRISVDFPDVVKSTTGKDIVVSQYELWGHDSTPGILERTSNAIPGQMVPGVTLPGLVATAENLKKEADSNPDGTFKLVAISNKSSFRVEGFMPHTVWTFKVRASADGDMLRAGRFSAEFDIEMEPDDFGPDQPTKPNAVANKGTITVSWDGSAVTGAMPPDFAYVELAHGTSSSPTQVIERFYRGGGFTVIADVPYYDPQFFRLRAVDDSGHKSAWSEQAMAYTSPLVDEDMILSTIDGAKTYLKNIDAGVAILPNTILTEHLVVTEEMTAAIANFLHVKAGMIEANAVTTDKLDVGAVTAEKLEAALALVSKIIAGDADGTHAQMDWSGFRVYAADLLDGIPNEVVRMGVAETDDFFAVTRSNGTLAATISQDGVISGTSIYANDSLYYKGTELMDVLGRLPKGVVVTGGHYFGEYGDAANILIGNASYYGILAANVPTSAYRVYKFTFLSPTWASSTGGELQLEFKFRITNAGDTSEPTIGNTGVWERFIRTYSGAGSWERDVWEAYIGCGPEMDDKQIQVLITGWHGPGGNTGYVRLFQSAQLVVEDVGNQQYAGTAYHTSGDGSQYSAPPTPPAPVQQTYVTQWGCYDSMNYTGGNGQYLYNLGQMYQGLSPVGYGNLKSIGLFGDMTGALAGSTINYVRVYFNFNHWYYNAGGTARIGVHGHTGIPATYGGVGPLTAISGGWPKPGARWVDISRDHWDGFKTGQWRGVYLEGDGTLNTYGYADRPIIEISYTK